jgi:hypothetical protein
MQEQKFEERIIDKLLEVISVNLDYLTQPENIPALGKLGHIYNRLWYAGRFAYGYEGKLRKDNQCDENPKYKLEICDVGTPEQYNLVYDAWGMHITMEEKIPLNFDNFKNLILNGKNITELDKKMGKLNKTIDDWVEIKTDENYRYKSLYPDRKSVVDHLLCTIGNGYGYKNGFVFEEAGGADMNMELYFNWENATFPKHIQEVVDFILEDEEVKEILDFQHAEAILFYEKREKDKKDSLVKALVKLGKTQKEIELFIEDLFNEDFITPDTNKYKPYYPICDYSIITMFDENTHDSYIKAAIEICKDILENSSLERESNVKFANSFLNKDFIKNVNDKN